MESAVRFIRKGGRIIPIHVPGAGKVAKHALSGARAAKAGSNAVVGVSAAVAARRLKKQPPVKVNRALDLGALGLSVASGAIAAATFSSGAKGFLAGAALTHGIDAAGIAANVASVAGKGNVRGRTKQAAKQEARNLVIGNAIYAAGVIGSSKNRATLVSAGKKVLAFARKALKVV